MLSKLINRKKTGALQVKQKSPVQNKLCTDIRTSLILKPCNQITFPLKCQGFGQILGLFSSLRSFNRSHRLSETGVITENDIHIV